MKDIEIVYPKTKAEWRTWLEANHLVKDNVWVIFYKKASLVPTITWREAVDEALCFGWIDSVKKKRDDQSSIQFFSKRKPKSTWSKINKDIVEILIKEGLMTEAGFKSIEIAKKNGSWTFLDSVEALTIPQDLQKEFQKYPEANTFFEGLSKSIKKMMLYWIISAKRPETRQNRIQEIVTQARLGKKPKQFEV